MSSKSGTNKVAALVMLAVAVAGCSEMYYDRRDSVSLGAGDAIAINRTSQTPDPWPRHSMRTQLAFDGERMQTAVQRHRMNKSIPPVNVTTSSAAYQQIQQQAAQAATATGVATSATPAAAVKGPGSP